VEQVVGSMPDDWVPDESPDKRANISADDAALDHPDSRQHGSSADTTVAEASARLVREAEEAERAAEVR
jgi:hypothetical protein